MKKISLIFHTLIHVKPIQVFYRLKIKFIKPKLINSNYNFSRRNVSGDVKIQQIRTRCFFGDMSFNFLNEYNKVITWNDIHLEKLWLYNLHYFDYIQYKPLKYKSDYLSLIEHWIDNNPFPTGNGWEPYPLSLRIVNWVKFFLSTGNFKNEALESLHNQVNVLYQTLEYHLLGNHLFANAKALVFAGCYFDGEDAEKWLKLGLFILDKEINEQILNDGGNFELSPMYHNIILSDMLDLYSLCIAYDSKLSLARKEKWESIIVKMYNWSHLMGHPNDEVAFFNDSANGIAPKLESIFEYANSLGINVRSENLVLGKEIVCNVLESSGYIVVQNKHFKAILDVAKVGPDYIPGHAHADNLSFELNVGDQRVFVNSGTSVYGLSDERLRQRKTKAHNTVVVDDEDSSEVWSGFRVARRAYPSNPIITESDSEVIVECSHDGYMRLPGKVMHTRKWKLAKDELLICDLLSGVFNHAEAHYHIHPEVHVESPSVDGHVTLHLPNGTSYKVRAEGADIRVQDTTWHPEFGLSIANKKLVLNFQQNEIKFFFTRA
ncbi:TPA: heparinase II/III family protein [Vibrio parahaemolyticus]